MYSRWILVKTKDIAICTSALCVHLNSKAFYFVRFTCMAVPPFSVNEMI